MTRRAADALADELLARILPLDLDRQKDVMDRIVAAVNMDRAHRMYPPPPVLPPLPPEPRPAPVISPEEAAARVLDAGMWGDGVCYGDEDWDCEAETRPHLHPGWGCGMVVLDRETGGQIDRLRHPDLGE